MVLTIIILLAMMGGTISAEYVNSDDGLRLRKSPNEEAEIITVLPFGEQVSIVKDGYGNDASWTRIISSNKIGYVKSKHLQETDPIEDLEFLGAFHVTAYAETGNACANGNYPEVGYTIACNSLDFGTRVWIEGIGFRVVEDRGPAGMGDKWLDLYLGNHSDCVSFGSQQRDVYLLNTVEEISNDD